jgi:hypothetical protein
MQLRYKPGLSTAGLLTAVGAVAMLGSETLSADEEGGLFIALLFLGGSMLAAIGLLRRLLRAISLRIRWPSFTASRSRSPSGDPAHGHSALTESKVRNELLANFDG